MKVFISWSGPRSKALAIALKEWVPLILQYAKPWVSDKDISAGERWAKAIAGELETSNFGILCITPENLRSEWILFEAGALSKSMLDAKVIPLLFGLELSDLSGPLSQFQALKIDQQGMMGVIKAINAVSETKAAEETIHQLVPALWPQFQSKIDQIPNHIDNEKHSRPQTDILEELVSQVRGLDARVRDFSPEVIDRETIYYSRAKRDRELHMLDDIMKMLLEFREGEMSLLFIAGLVRDRLPWLAEVLLETHRELKTAEPEESKEIGRKLIRFSRNVLRGPISEKMFSRDPDDYILMRELSRLIERALLFKLESRQIADDRVPEGEASGA